jgi:hypothetical protein
MRDPIVIARLSQATFAAENRGDIVVVLAQIRSINKTYQQARKTRHIKLKNGGTQL